MASEQRDTQSRAGSGRWRQARINAEIVGLRLRNITLYVLWAVCIVVFLVATANLLTYQVFFAGYRPIVMGVFDAAGINAAVELADVVTLSVALSVAWFSSRGRYLRLSR